MKKFVYLFLLFIPLLTACQNKTNNSKLNFGDYYCTYSKDEYNYEVIMSFNNGILHFNDMEVKDMSYEAKGKKLKITSGNDFFSTAYINDNEIIFENANYDCQKIVDKNFSSDKIPPLFKVSGGSDDWKNKYVTLLISNVSDRGIGLDSLPYSFNGGKTWTKENKKVYSSGINVVDICVRDKNKNKKCITKKVNVDTIPPILYVTGVPFTVSENDILLTIVGSDIGSGLDSLAYSFDNGKTWSSANTKKYTQNMNENVSVCVKDKAGNKSCSLTKVNIEKPEIELSYYSYSSYPQYKYDYVSGSYKKISGAYCYVIKFEVTSSKYQSFEINGISDINSFAGINCGYSNPEYEAEFGRTTVYSTSYITAMQGINKYIGYSNFKPPETITISRK